MRYCGSKAKFAKDIIPIITEHLDDGIEFYDAFMGGANILSRVEHPMKVGVEINFYVYSLWNNISRSCKTNVPVESWLPSSLTREEYNMVKEAYLMKDYSKYKPWMIGFVGACCSYGGAWFNGYAAFNPKKNEDHIKEAYNGLVKQVKSFKNLSTTEFRFDSYENIRPNRNAVIYCDPPYEMTKKYESDFDHLKFWAWVRHMSKEGNHVYVSEYTAPSDFECIWMKEKKDGMGTTTEGREQNTKIEKLFVYSEKF